MKLRCIKPTRTLTKGKLYDGGLLKAEKKMYSHTENLDEAILFVVYKSDTGKRISCNSDRFERE